MNTKINHSLIFSTNFKRNCDEARKPVIREFHQGYLFVLTETRGELVVWVSGGVGWIKRRCSQGRKGQHGTVQESVGHR
jgi:hypothetical protein